MSVQVNGINVIDDDRNFSAAGIVTVGTGNSATIIDGTTGITSVGIGITMEGVPGNISIAGTLTAAGFNIPASIVSFSPANGATNVAVTTSIVITFDQVVGTANTGYIYLRAGSAGGTTIETFGVDDVAIINGTNTTLNITPSENLEFSTDVYTVIEEGFIKSTSGDFAGLNVAGADSYSFTTKAQGPGDPAEGGYIICQASSVRWIVAPLSAEVSRNWYSRSDAVTTAQASAACGDWFVPSIGQLQNPGYACKTYWDSFSNCCYWSNSEYSPFHGWAVSQFGNTRVYGKGDGFCVRAFRCVSY